MEPTSDGLQPRSFLLLVVMASHPNSDNVKDASFNLLQVLNITKKQDFERSTVRSRHAIPGTLDDRNRRQRPAQ